MSSSTPPDAQSSAIAHSVSSHPNAAHPDAVGTDEPEARQPNLALYYGLVALALVLAIVLALLIVRPFYEARH